MGYSPTIGRFLEMDPDTYIDGPNEYQFEESNTIDSVDPTGTEKYQNLPKEDGNTNPTPANGAAPTASGDPVDVKLRAGSDLNNGFTFHGGAYGPALGDTDVDGIINEIVKQANGHPVNVIELNVHGEPPAKGQTPDQCQDTGKAIFFSNDDSKPQTGATAPAGQMTVVTQNGAQKFANALKQKVVFGPGAKLRLNACYSGYRGLAQALADALGIPVEAPTGEVEIGNADTSPNKIGTAKTGQYQTFTPTPPATQPAK